MTDPRANDMSNPHYQLNCAIPDGVDYWLIEYGAPGESAEETCERHLTAEPDFPLGSPVVRAVPLHEND